MGVTVIQETRTENVPGMLRDLSALRALVIRNGERIRFAAGVRASAVHPIDPMKVAIHAAQKAAMSVSCDRLTHGPGLRPERLAMACVWAAPDNPGKQGVNDGGGSAGA